MPIIDFTRPHPPVFTDAELRASAAEITPEAELLWAEPGTPERPRYADRFYRTPAPDMSAEAAWSWLWLFRAAWAALFFAAGFVAGAATALGLIKGWW